MSSHVRLQGSYAEHPSDSITAGALDSDQIIQVTVVLKRRAQAAEPAHFNNRLSHDELAQEHGAEPADLEAVAQFAAEHRFFIAHVNKAARSVTLSGPVGMLAAAFGADLEMRAHNGAVVRMRKGHLHVPAALGDRVVAVLGFDERVAAATYRSAVPRASQTVCYTPQQLAKIYNFPTNVGKNQTIAMIELGGGFNKSDLTTYWRHLGIANVSTTAVSVDGTGNMPTGDANSADGEVALDIEVAGGVAPGAHIAVYFAPNTDKGFLDAITAAIHDKVRKPSVISISWGSAESQWTGQAMDAFNEAFHDAALLGITVCAAAGDNGSSDGLEDGGNHVDFPASSPWVLACGGTRLYAKDAASRTETVWNDGTNGGATGGGVSVHFPRPSYQNVAGTTELTGRGVPDVAGLADPETGYVVLVDGKQGIVGGTSAVAPLWAGLIALINEQVGKNVGWIHPVLYGTADNASCFHDVVSGTNGAYNASKGWDACTGLGTPDGMALLNAFKQNKK